MKRLILLLLVALASFSAIIEGHGSSDVYVRVVSANPVTKTYTFSCNADQQFVRDWFIRPEGEGEEAVILDKPANEFLTYTFKANKLYHIGCIIVDTTDFSKQYRGDLHIDLSADKPDHKIVPISSNGLSTTLDCQSSISGTPSWQVIDARTGITTSLGSGKTKTYTAPGHGLFDFVCSISGKENGLPVEFFDKGNPYFPDNKGVPHGITNEWIRDVAPSDGSAGNGSTPRGAISGSLQTLPATCQGGVISSDTYDGGRHISCQGGANTLSVSAWEKPDSGEKQYFEMYKKSQIGSGIKICIGTTCLQNDGYAKSSPYSNIPPNGSGTSGPVAPNASVQRLSSIIASCVGGSIISDTYDGGRHIKCQGSTGSLAISAWEKPDGAVKEYFEMYKQSQAGFGQKICLGNTCIQENGYAKSPLYSTSVPEVPSDGGSSTVLSAPIWLSHTIADNVAPDSFHLEAMEPANPGIHKASEFEIWSASEKVWSLYGATGTLRYHVHTPDGTFSGSLSGMERLEYSTTYNVRARYVDTSNLKTDWSSWRTFTTKAKPTLDPTAPSWTAASGYSVTEFASGFNTPVHVAAAPKIYSNLPLNKRPYLYVTELYGTIKVVYADGSSAVYASGLLNFDPFGSITGGGQMGLTGLYVDESGDLFAGMVYKEGDGVKNKIVKFDTASDGSVYLSTQTIISNLPSAASHQIQQIAKGPDGRLYVGLGDALTPSNAQSDSILAGKIISMKTDGSDVQVHAKGLRNPFGLDFSASGALYATDNAPDTDDRLIQVIKGENYGWGLNDNFATFHQKRIFTLDVSPVDLENNKGNSDFSGELYVAVAGPIYQQGPQKSKHILEFQMDGSGNILSHRELVKYTGAGYGTPVGLDFVDNALFFTDIYGEAGFISLGKTDSKIYKVALGAGGAPSGGNQFIAGIEISPWYPKLTGSIVEYEFTCKGIYGSGNYVYDFNYGDGSSISNDLIGKKLHSYPYTNKAYTVSCIVHDKNTGQSRSASMQINPINFIAEK